MVINFSIKYIKTISSHSPLYEVGLDYRHGTGHGIGHFLGVHEGECLCAPVCVCHSWSEILREAWVIKKMGIGYMLFMYLNCFSITAPTQVRIYSKEEHELEVGQFFSDGKYGHQFIYSSFINLLFFVFIISMQGCNTFIAGFVIWSLHFHHVFVFIV